MHHTMVALKLQQFQYNLKKIFLRRLVLPELLGPNDGSLPLAKGGEGGYIPDTGQVQDLCPLPPYPLTTDDKVHPCISMASRVPQCGQGYHLRHVVPEALPAPCSWRSLGPVSRPNPTWRGGGGVLFSAPLDRLCARQQMRF